MEYIFIRVVTYPKSQDCCWEVEEEDIDDDHVEDPSDLLFIADDEMESRIEH